MQARSPGRGGDLSRLAPPFSTREFVFLGQTGKRRFTDKTLPAGSAGVIYKVQAVRSTSEGQAARPRRGGPRSTS